MARRRGRAPGPIPIADSLAQLAQGLAPDLKGLAAVQRAWEGLVDEGLRAHARPLKLSGSTLVIAVDSPSTATQMRLVSGAIVAQLHQATGVELDGVEVVVRKA
jgi:hypothetical protein